jgi:CelD/BcsL family acetyltransferase involved in cellulose biosynthesis
MRACEFYQAASLIVIQPAGAHNFSSGGVMQLAVIRTLPEFEALKDEWNGLLVYSASHVPFLRNEYLSAWWEGLGGGEWEAGDLFVVTGRNAEGVLLGIAPLFCVPQRDGKPVLMLLGSIEISDYLDVIAHPDALADFTRELLCFLDQQGPSPNMILDLYNLPEWSPTLPALAAAAAALGWSFTKEPLQPCPYIQLPGDWETYLVGIDKKQRHEIRRKMRRAGEYHLPVHCYMVKDSNTLDEEVEGLFSLMAKDQEKAQFLTQAMRAQMSRIIQLAYDQGWLQLAFIEVGGEKAAAYLNLDYGDQIWVYNSGYDPQYREISPGWVLLGYLLKWANENNRRIFDFMRGDEEYKYRFGAVDRWVVRVQLSKDLDLPQHQPG